MSLDCAVEHSNFFRISDEPLIVADILDLVEDPGAGAISSFIGVTRNNFGGRRVIKLEYEGYVPMAEKEILKLMSEIRSRWDVKKIAMYHRLGTRSSYLLESIQR
jgi:molybdopterin synthase catalytic subunit